MYSTALCETVKNQKEFFFSSATKSLSLRKETLKKLKNVIKMYEKDLLKALYLDLGKSEAEAYMSELSPVYSEINLMLKKVETFNKPERVKPSLTTITAKNIVYKEPFGTVLIISSWNYPVTLSLVPLTDAIAAGNTVILKPSEYSVNTSNLLVKILNENFSSEYIYAASPEIPHEEIWREKYDYIFYTGSSKVGKLVMAEAAKNITPVTLELGGKSPCIVDKTAKLEIAAKRIIRGKLMNAGQTCIAPDYLYVDNSIKDKFTDMLMSEINRQYPDSIKNPLYPQIINEKNFNRLVDLINNSKNVTGGKYDAGSLKIEPAIINDVKLSDEIMKEEIFGPILPVIGYNDISAVINEIKTGEKPLACYVFTENKTLAEKIIEEISFGGGCINDCLLHFSNPNLPFGGVGNSGIGQYHGKFGFETFSRKKAVVYNSTKIDIKQAYAPFDDVKLKIFKKLF